MEECIYYTKVFSVKNLVYLIKFDCSLNGYFE